MNDTTLFIGAGSLFVAGVIAGILNSPMASANLITSALVLIWIGLAQKNEEG